MATDNEILTDIQNIYTKIDQCYRSKSDISAQIIKERDDIVGLRMFIEADRVRVSQEKKPRFDEASMKENIIRCNNNIKLFEEKLIEEDKNILKFQNIVKVLQDDMARPKEITIDMTGK